MLNVLKVLGRVILVSIGLLAIAGGGLCVVLGSSSGSVSGIALIGLVSLLLGAGGVWLVFRNWKNDRARQFGDVASPHDEDKQA